MLSLIFILATLSGAIAGLVAAHWFLTHHRSDDAATQVAPPDPFVSAEIDRAAAEWAARQGRPEAAGLMADKLHLLYALGQRRSPR